MSRYSNPVPQYLDSAGKPYVDGKIFFYLSGTNTFQDTFKDVNLSIANANPIVLAADGRVPNIFLKSAVYNVLFTGTDSVTGLLTQVWQRDSVGGEGAEGSFSPWNSLTIYNEPDIVVVNDKFYLSITDGNQGNDPSTDTVNWSEIKFIGVWNTNQTYVLHDVVQGSDGSLYTSQTASNAGNDPTTDSVNWSPSIDLPTDNLASAVKAQFSFESFGGFN